MGPEPAQISDDLTLLVFKDNLASRTFRVPLRWVTGFGMLLGTFFLITLASLLGALKIYFFSTQASFPLTKKIETLQQEVADLKNQLKSEANPALVLAPVPPKPSQEAPVPSGPAPAMAVSGSQNHSFLPLSAQGPLVEPSSLSFTFEPPKVTWHGKRLNVSFALQYIRDDGGSQHGRIIIVARGPGVLFAYPAGALNLSQKDSLIEPRAGEYFSVSRFREVNATFGPVLNYSSVREIEIMIFGSDGKILAYQKHPVSPPTIQSPPAEVVNDGPKPESVQTSEKVIQGNGNEIGR